MAVLRELKEGLLEWRLEWLWVAISASVDVQEVEEAVEIAAVVLVEVVVGLPLVETLRSKRWINYLHCRRCPLPILRSS